MSRDDTETDSELSEGPLTRTGSAHSSRRALYTAELFSNSLTPAHRSPHPSIRSNPEPFHLTRSSYSCSSSGVDVRLASTTAARGHSWRGDHHPLFESKQQVGFLGKEGARFDDILTAMQAKQNTYNGESHISLPNFGKASEENREGPRTSVRKSNLKVKQPNAFYQVPHLTCKCTPSHCGEYHPVYGLQVPSGGVRLVGLSHTARNNAMV